MGMRRKTLWEKEKKECFLRHDEGLVTNQYFSWVLFHYLLSVLLFSSSILELALAFLTNVSCPVVHHFPNFSLVSWGVWEHPDLEKWQNRHRSRHKSLCTVHCISQNARLTSKEGLAIPLVAGP